MSYRNQPTEELTAKMIQLSHDSGYRGWYGIESKGREEVRRVLNLLSKISVEAMIKSFHAKPLSYASAKYIRNLVYLFFALLCAFA